MQYQIKININLNQITMEQFIGKNLNKTIAELQLQGFEYNPVHEKRINGELYTPLYDSKNDKTYVFISKPDNKKMIFVIEEIEEV